MFYPVIAIIQGGIIRLFSLFCYNLDRAILSTFYHLAGGDKPRHYKRSFAVQVGVGFIPTRKLACKGDDCRRKIAQFRYD